jgi:phenylacetic acid degradation operon negative regulatory protein
MLVYSLPEDLRSTRHSLRTQLAWLGFGLLAPGVWISPHDRQDELSELIEKLDISDRVEIFSSIYRGPTTPIELVEQCWELADLAAQYEQFLELHLVAYQELLDKPEQSLSLEEAFTRRFWLTHSFQSFPLKDPNLPIELLPENWTGTKARELFDNYHRLLGGAANHFVSNVLEESL